MINKHIIQSPISSLNDTSDFISSTYSDIHDMYTGPIPDKNRIKEETSKNENNYQSTTIYYKNNNRNNMNNHNNTNNHCENTFYSSIQNKNDSLTLTENSKYKLYDIQSNHSNSKHNTIYTNTDKSENISKNKISKLFKYVKKNKKDNVKDDHYDVQNNSSIRMKCLIFWTGKRAILIGTIIGTVIGLMINVLTNHKDTKKPTGNNNILSNSKKISLWLQLPGNIFLRVLQSLIGPMVFISLSIGIADLVYINKLSILGKRIFFFFLSTSILATSQSVMFGLLFKNLFYKESYKNDKTIERPNGNNEMITHNLNDDIIQLIERAFPKNIVYAFSEGNLLGIIFFAVFFGFSMGKYGQDHNINDNNNSVINNNTTKEKEIRNVDEKVIPVSAILKIMRQLNYIFLYMIQWMSVLTPFMLISIIGGALAIPPDKNKSDTNSLVDDSNSSLSYKDIVSKMGIFLFGYICCGITHIFIVYNFISFIVFRRIAKKKNNAKNYGGLETNWNEKVRNGPLNFYNFFFYLGKLYSALIFGFSTASSLATIPLTTSCIRHSKEISRLSARFLIPLSTILKMDGTAMYYPLAIIFLVESSEKVSIDISWSIMNIFMLLFVTCICSLGGAPIPSGGLIMLMSIWNVFTNYQELPKTFVYLVAVDWIIDRFRTVVNIICVAFITRILATYVDE